MPETTVKERWFELGARALNTFLTPKIGDKYVCPLCRKAFDRGQIDTDLSFEHAPPESVGGRAVALTCRRCNNRAGTELDSEMLRRHRAQQLALGGSMTLERVEATIEDKVARGQLTFGPNRFNFVPIDRQNKPEDLRQHFEVSDQWARDRMPGHEIMLSIPVQANPLRANLSWMRSAFVAAFATFGYLYTFQPAFDKLLTQIQNPNDHSDIPLPILFDDAAPVDTRKIALVIGPQPLRSVMVRMGQMTVFLPSEWDDNFFHEFGDRRAQVVASAPDPTALSLDILAFDWPRSPQHLWDGIDTSNDRR